ncbi:MAG: DUF357 domain-containing protein [Crenarchaeota archaeon]|nr:DUF357 domain-containing protein [Thermoproteota archaeon]
MTDMKHAETCKRAEKYARGVLETLAKLEEQLPASYQSLLDASKRYAKDALYYVDIGDCDTALSAASYAEGLIDALKYTGVLEPEWPARPVDEKTVFVAGTFDIIHPGHVELLRYASRYGKVHVVVARDKNVVYEKNKQPILDEQSRLKVISSIRYVYKAMLGDEHDKMKPLEIIKPDVIVLGPDQPYDPDKLAEIVEERTGKKPLVVRFDEKKPFSDGLRGTRDIIRKICRGTYCSNSR